MKKRHTGLPEGADLTDACHPAKENSVISTSIIEFAESLLIHLPFDGALRYFPNGGQML